MSIAAETPHVAVTRSAHQKPPDDAPAALNHAGGLLGFTGMERQGPRPTQEEIQNQAL
jgi:hypothetical protein